MLCIYRQYLKNDATPNPTFRLIDPLLGALGGVRKQNHNQTTKPETCGLFVLTHCLNRIYDMKLS